MLKGFCRGMHDIPLDLQHWTWAVILPGFLLHLGFCRAIGISCLPWWKLNLLRKTMKGAWSSQLFSNNPWTSFWWSRMDRGYWLLFLFGIFVGQEGFHAFHDGKACCWRRNCLLSWKAWNSSRTATLNTTFLVVGIWMISERCCYRTEVISCIPW